MTGYAAPIEVGRFGRAALAAGALGLALLLVGALSNWQQFFRSYLIGYLFWAGVGLGCLAVLMLEHLSGGKWGLLIRRQLEAASRTIPLMAILFIPILIGISEIYSWARAEEVAASHALKHKQPYLNVTFFGIRAAFYFALWILLAWLLSNWSRRQDYAEDPRGLKKKLQALAGPGLVLFGLTDTFASFDWVMSLEPEFASTIFGMLLIGGQALSAMAFVIISLTWLARWRPLSEVVRPDQLHDLGKLLLAFVMLWAYFAFSQFLIIWSGNLPEEIPWYLHRLGGGWQWVGLALIVFHFALPFLLLLSRDVKRSSKPLLIIASLIFVLRLVDLFWLVAPEFYHQIGPRWMDLAAVVGLGGLWLWAFAQQLQKSPLLPVGDPKLEGLLIEGGHMESHEQKG
jgi:hypothetical protein